MDAVTDARRVAATLGIPHYPWDLEKDFRDEIIADFEDGYAAGRAPNPCVRCNERIKFGVLFARARAIGATHLATGHHARTGRRGSRATLHRSANSAKDQAYTLHRVPSSTLKAAVFPLGSMSSKEDVRSEARRLGLVTADKPDSQELCFVDSTVRVELQRRLKGRYGPGAIVDEAGNRVGAHEGLPFFTVGQRGGLNLAPQRPDAAPSYVVRLDVEANTIVTGPRASLQSSAVRADNAAWIAAPPRAGDAVGIQVTAHGTCHAATVTEAGANFGATFALPVGHVSPGQALVVYRGDEVLGGATISGGAS